jgi:hypothetical protein
MRHPTDGALRRLLDEPAGVADAEREHIAGCRECLAGVAAAQEDAALTGAALDVSMHTDVDAAWQRLSQAAAADASDPEATAGPARRWQLRRRRWSLRSPVVAGAGVLVLLAGAGAAAAVDWLQIFRTERVAPVTVTQEDLTQLPDLSAYGQVRIVDRVRIRDVASAAAAETATGLDAPQVDDLPRGVTGEPTFEVVDEVSGIFTFSAAEARQAAEAEGEALPPPPAGLDGSRFRLEAGPGLAAVWSEERGLPALVVARSVAPTAYSSGVPFETARTYLLSLPGLPEDLASQLRSFSGDGATLPVPVHEDLMTSSSTDVDGLDATLLETRDGTMAAVVWVQDGVVTAVAGSLSDDEVLAVARGLG